MTISNDGSDRIDMPGMKSLAFLRHAVIFLAGAAKSVYWLAATASTQPDRIVARIRARSLKASMLRGSIDRLERRYRAADFVLSRVLRAKRASLARSCTVYEYALRMGLFTRLCVGADGRAWVEIGGIPFMETEKQPSDKVIVFER